MRQQLFIIFSGAILSLGAFRSDIAADMMLGDHEWKQWKHLHTKCYASNNEELERYVIWQTNKAYVEYHNALADNFGYTLALNKFGDMAFDEFCRNTECSEIDKGPLFVNASYFNASGHERTSPPAVDWRQKGIVTAVKDQGMCHSCYAFAVTGLLEGLHGIATGKLVSLSEQNIIDCSVLYGNRGCSGGDRAGAVSYITDNGGINTEADYPYRARQGLCNFSSSAVTVSCTGIIRIQYGKEDDLMTAVATSGPVSVSVDASHSTFQFYSSGIYSQPFCSSTELTHSLLVVGYGSLNGKNYWLLKNSWGVNWGEDGYIMMARDSYNMCGIASSAFFLAM